MRTRETDVEPFVNLSELTEIELLIMRRMREFTIGEHRSLFTGSGFDFVGLRDWQPGDRTSNIDWAQSTLTNFSPMIVRDYEQRSTATVVADRRRLAVDPLRHRRRADRRGDRAHHRHHRHVGGVLPGPVRPDHLRRQVRAARGDPPARRQEPGDPHARGLSVRQRPAAAEALRQPEHVARRLHAQDLDGAGDLRLPVRRSRRA